MFPFPSCCGSAWGAFLDEGGGAGRCGALPECSAQCSASPQTSLRQMTQVRFYVAESRVVVPHVSLYVAGLPPGLSAQEYGSLLEEAAATKGVTAWLTWEQGEEGRASESRPRGLVLLLPSSPATRV